MAYNFRISGSNYIYVSKAGNDSNAGTNQNLPKLTVQSALNTTSGSIVVGAGTYQETLSMPGANQTLYADGQVILYGNGTGYLSATNSFVGTNFYNFTIQNYAYFTGITYSNFKFYNCIVNGIGYTTIISNNGGIFSMYFYNSVLLNSTINGYTVSQPNIPDTNTFQNGVMINSTWQTANTSYNAFYNNYVDQSSKLNFYTSSTNVQTSIYNNDIEGQISFGSGSFSGSLLYLSASRAVYTSITSSNFSQSPLFNNSASLDFTIPANSPLIKNGNGGTNIATSVANIASSTYYAQTSSVWNPTNGAVWTNVTSSNGVDIIISGSLSGSITSAPIFLSTSPVLVNNLGYVGFLLFNKSASGSSATNNNVPVTTVYSGSDSSGGGNPNFLTVEARWTNTAGQPAVNSNWLNGGLITAGNYGVFLLNKQPYVDNFGYGNGSPYFATGSVGNAVYATWMQFRVTLTNSYL